MRHLQVGVMVGIGIVFGGVVWNMLGDTAGVVIALAVSITILVAFIDWYTEKETPE